MSTKLGNQLVKPTKKETNLSKDKEASKNELTTKKNNDSIDQLVKNDLSDLEESIIFSSDEEDEKNNQDVNETIDYNNLEDKGNLYFLMYFKHHFLN